MVMTMHVVAINTVARKHTRIAVMMWTEGAPNSIKNHNVFQFGRVSTTFIGRNSEKLITTFYKSALLPLLPRCNYSIVVFLATRLRTQTRKGKRFRSTFSIYYPLPKNKTRT